MATHDADPHRAQADLILRGGVVHPLTDAVPQRAGTEPTALAVREGLVVRVGSDAEVEGAGAGAGVAGVAVSACATVGAAAAGVAGAAPCWCCWADA